MFAFLSGNLHIPDPREMQGDAQGTTCILCHVLLSPQSSATLTARGQTPSWL